MPAQPESKPHETTNQQQGCGLPPHPEDPVGENPCPFGHPAHRVWEDATRDALRESFRLQERMLGKRPRTAAQHQGWFIELAFGKFQIWAKRNLSIVRTDADARAYEQWLDSLLQSWLKLAGEQDTVEFRGESLLPELKLQLLRASKYWVSNALESVAAFRKRAGEETSAAPEASRAIGDPPGATLKTLSQPAAMYETQAAPDISGVAASPLAAPPGRRRSYRGETQEWMAREGISTLEVAAKRLGISLSTLKSIRSDRGKPRYAEATLIRILGIMGCKGG